MPTTRCKFYVSGYKTFGTPGHASTGAEVELSAIYPNKDADGFEHGEDHAFFAATPTGKLTLTVNNPYGAEILQPGKLFYLDLTEVPEPDVAAS